MARDGNGTSDDAQFAETYKARGGVGRDSAVLRPPEVLGRYRIVDLIGHGQYGAVFRAVDVDTHARVAMKVVRSSDIERVFALQTEARWLAKLNRPNVVKLFGQGETDEFTWLAMELVEGRSLQQIVADQHPIDAGRDQRRTRSESDVYIRRAMTWMRDLARALDALHGVEGLHRDIKPANIVIHESGAPYLIDFGLGIGSYETDEQTSYLAGTAAYMSPEQASLLPVGPKSDLYSLAVTFHEAVTGRRVVKASTLHGARREVLGDPVAAPSTVNPDVPPTLDGVFAKALCKKEEARYSTGAELADDLDAWLEGRPTPNAGPAEPQRRQRRRRRVTAFGVGLALVIAAAWPLKGWAERARLSSDREAAIAAIRELQEAGRLDEAQNECAHFAERFGDARPVLDLWRNIESDWRGTAIEATLNCLVVATPGRTSTRLRQHAEQAEANLRWADLPTYRFRAALGRYFGVHDDDASDVRATRALQLLAPAASRAIGVEDELRALCFLALGDGAGSDQIAAQTAARLATSNRNGPNEVVMIAYRELAAAKFALAAAPRLRPESRPAGGPRGPWCDRFDRAEALLVPIVGHRGKPGDDPPANVANPLPFRPEAAALLANVYLEHGRHDASGGHEPRFIEAAETYERVNVTLAKDRPADERDGTRLMSALSHLLVAFHSPGRREEASGRARAYLDELLSRSPPLATFVACRLHELGGWKAARDWMGSAPQRPPNLPCATSTYTLAQLAANSLAECKSDEAMEALNAFADLAIEVSRGSTSGDVADAVRAAQTHRLYGAWLLLDGAEPTENAIRLAAHVVTGGENVFERFKSLEPDGELEWAFAVAFLSRYDPATPESQRTAARVARAIETLRKAAADRVVEETKDPNVRAFRDKITRSTAALLGVDMNGEAKR